MMKKLVFLFLAAALCLPLSAVDIKACQADAKTRFDAAKKDCNAKGWSEKPACFKNAQKSYQDMMTACKSGNSSSTGDKSAADMKADKEKEAREKAAQKEKEAKEAADKLKGKLPGF